jgi:hypothetical protein
MTSLPIRIAACAGMLALAAPAGATPDYAKRGAPLDPALAQMLIGKWTNPVDKVVIEITAVDPVSGKIAGKEWPTTGQASGDEHELTGWVSAGATRAGFDTVTPITFSTTLFEYGTLPAWAGFLRDGKITTMHYLVWPTKMYSWDHIAAFQETWSRIP